MKIPISFCEVKTMCKFLDFDFDFSDRNSLPQYFEFNYFLFENMCFNCPLDCKDCIFGRSRPFKLVCLGES